MGGSQLRSADSVSDGREQKSGLRAILIAVAAGAVVAAIGIHQGGYGLPTVGQIAIGGLWLLLIGAILGIIGRVRPRGSSAWALGLLGALLIWTVISVLWSDASERTIATAIQLEAVVVVFGLASVLLTRRERNAVIAGVAGGIALLALLAVMQRLNLPILGAPVLGADQLGHQSRSHWPVGYWNALAALCAMALPILLRFASADIRMWDRAVSAACVPVVSLALIFTISRGGLVLAVIAVGLSLVLGPLGRRDLLTQLALVLCSAVVLAVALRSRELMDGFVTSGPGASQAEIVLAVLVCVTLVSALIGAFIGGWGDAQAIASTNIDQRLKIIGGVVCALTLVFAVLALSGSLDSQFQKFKSTDSGLPASRGNSVDRLSTVGSNGRWQLWQGAIDAGNEHPLIGQGGGEFELWWLAHGSRIKVRNAHGLFVETYADLGVVGVVLLIGFIGAAGLGCVRALRRAGDQLGTVAAGVASFVVFLLSCAGDWTWQETVAPIAAVLILSSLLAPEHSGDKPTVRSRLVTGIVALAGFALVLPPTIASTAVQGSKQSIRKGELAGALSQANAATAWQPYSASAWQQKALVLDATGNPTQARAAALRAIENEPQGWQNWLVLSAIDARAGRVGQSVAEFRRARTFNPNSNLFKPTN